MKKYKIKIEDKEYIVEVEEISNSSGEVSSKTVLQSRVVPPENDSGLQKEELLKAHKTKSEEAKGKTFDSASVSGEEIIAPMPGKILKIMVSVGDRIAEGDVIMVLEAMKMENEIYAGSDGTIGKISVSVNDMVDTGDTLVIIN